MLVNKTLAIILSYYQSKIILKYFDMS